MSLLGAGGMGEVYRARDKKLDREVAIKVLPESLAADPAALARFEREAKAVAALSHPNILAIHDLGTHEGISYAVMELLEGETLRAKLDAGPIPQKQAIDCALQIVKGLSAAHEKGIVHRDLKPENLFVGNDGHLKILDFGLAKRNVPVTPGEESNTPTVSVHTEPGAVMGTVGYMSPEQVRGLSVDHRSDIFSFGAILYEMLSGKRAFKRNTAADTMSAIMKEEPAELSGSGRSVPPALDHIVKRCLEKERDRRFHSAHDLAFALAEHTSSAGSLPVAGSFPNPSRRKGIWLAVCVAALVMMSALGFLLWRQRTAPSSGSTSGSPKRLAVLRFENKGDAQDAYLAEGMTEDIINRLTNLRELRVISRTTVMGYDPKGKTIKQIGADLGVDYLLEGTIRWERSPGRQGRIRITPALIQVADDTNLWNKQYDRVLEDIFVIQSEVAESVSRAMALNLVSREKTALAAVSTSDMEAYDFYLRGLKLAGRSMSSKDQDEAIRMFQAAVNLDPGFSQALEQLARAHLSIYFYFDRLLAPPDRTHIESARKVIENLSLLGADLPETRIARGTYLYWGLDKPEPALVDFKAVLELQPSNTSALRGYHAVLRRLDRWKEAGELVPRLAELDPRNPELLYQCGLTPMMLRRYEEGERLLALSTMFNRQFESAWGRRILLQTQCGDLQKAEQRIAEVRTIEGLPEESALFNFAIFRVPFLKRDFHEALLQVESMKRPTLNHQYFFFPKELLRGELYALSGMPDQARRSFQASRLQLEELTSKAPQDSRYHSALAIAYAGLGLRAEALREAQAGVELMPISSDAWRAMWRLRDLAYVHTMLGNQNEAIDGLEFLLSRPSELSAQLLRIDPSWDPLRSNPRFQALLSKYGDKP